MVIACAIDEFVDFPPLPPPPPTLSAIPTLPAPPILPIPPTRHTLPTLPDPPTLSPIVGIERAALGLWMARRPPPRRTLFRSPSPARASRAYQPPNLPALLTPLHVCHYTFFTILPHLPVLPFYHFDVLTPLPAISIDQEQTAYRSIDQPTSKYINESTNPPLIAILPLQFYHTNAITGSTILPFYHFSISAKFPPFSDLSILPL